MSSDASIGGTSEIPMELRAGERVRQFILSRFNPPAEGESRLPTNKELARLLDVSPGTVQSVLKQLAQEGRIRSRRGSGTFLVSERRQRPASEQFRVGISLAIERLQALDSWLQQIGGGMFQAGLSHHIILEGVTASSAGTDSLYDELMAKRDSLDAMVVFPYTVSQHHAAITQAFEKVGKPIIDIHPPYVGATANFTSTDFFRSSFELGKALFLSGRRRFMKLSHFNFSRRILYHGVSHNLRLMGWLAGTGADHNPECSHTLLPTEMGTQQASYDAVKKYLAAGGPIPDAVYCPGDWMAQGAMHAFEDAGFNVPEEISIIGASGLDASQLSISDMTRVRHDLAGVGRRAIEMVVQRLREPGLSLPGIYLPTSFIGGGTTRAEENRLLAIPTASTLRSKSSVM